MAENIPNLGIDMNIQVHESHRSQTKKTLKRSSTKHIIMTFKKLK